MSGIRDSGAEEAHELDSLSELCEQLVGPHALATSLVMATHVHDTETDLAFGANVGREVEPTDLCELHCLAKPIVAWSLLESASAHGFDPSAPASSLLPDADHLDESVTVVGICNHLTRLAQPAALDWVSRPTHARPGIRSLRQEPDGAWYSEVGSWIVATALINALTGQPTLDVVSGLIERCDADAYIGTDPPPGRRVLVPIAGLPTRAIPMLHVDHPSYRSRLGPEFGGFGSMTGYVRFLREVGRAIRREPSAITVSDDVLEAALTQSPSMPQNETWHRRARFLGGFLDAETPHEPGQPGMLLMAAGVGSAACILDPIGDRQAAFWSDAASFDAADHQFLRRQILGTFIAATGPAA